MPAGPSSALEPPSRARSVRPSAWPNTPRPGRRGMKSRRQVLTPARLPPHSSEQNSQLPHRDRSGSCQRPPEDPQPALSLPLMRLIRRAHCLASASSLGGAGKLNKKPANGSLGPPKAGRHFLLSWPGRYRQLSNSIASADANQRETSGSEPSRPKLLPAALASAPPTTTTLTPLARQIKSAPGN